MEEEKNAKLKKIKLIVYLAILAVIIIIVRISGTTNSDSNENNMPNEATNKIIEKIKNINDKYHTINAHLVLDDDAISLKYQKIDTVEMGLKKYHKEQTEYTKKDNIYYKFIDGSFVKLENFIDFDYDKTFIDLNNIKKLLNLGKITIKNIEDGKQKIINTIELKDVIKIYNDYNNKTSVIYNDGNITLETVFQNETFEYILINTTDFYNEINKTNLEKVEYKIRIKEDKKEDISWMLEKIN